jgi:hypothetical protein
VPQRHCGVVEKRRQCGRQRRSVEVKWRRFGLGERPYGGFHHVDSGGRTRIGHDGANDLDDALLGERFDLGAQRMLGHNHLGEPGRVPHDQERDRLQ